MSLQLCPLQDSGVIVAEGRDAGAFLHAQLSQDIANLGAERAPLAGWHDARGRVRALFRVLRLPDRWLLGAPAASIDATLGELARFVLRADVRLTAGENWAAAALLGDHAGWLAERGSAAPERDTVQIVGGLHCVHAAPGLAYLFGTRSGLAELAGSLPQGPAENAELAAIRAGLPQLTPALAGRFVPQMLNLDRLGAISFTKGCYPGQEIVARAHHLGTVKRRMHRYAAPTAVPPAPGETLLGKNGEALGDVIRAAGAGEGIELLAVVPEEALRAPLFIQSGAARIPLEHQPLPYDVP